MTATLSPDGDFIVARWRDRFRADPTNAIGQALLGQVSFGHYDRARPAEILAQILRDEEIAAADEAVLAWIKLHVRRPIPPKISAKRFSEGLVEAYRVTALLRLEHTRQWSSKHQLELRSWVRNFRFGSSRDPEAAILVALSQDQRNRSLLPLWQSVIKKGRPIEHVRHALTGLRFLPADDSGTVDRSLPRALLQGLLEFGETLVRLGDLKGSPWFAEIDFLASVYPISKDAWGRKFRELMQTRPPGKEVHNWLDQRYPLATKTQAPSAKSYSLHPGQFDELKEICASPSSNRSEVKSKIEHFLSDSRHYSEETGDAYYLVRFLRFTSDQVRENDAKWARELAHEAAVWAPGDPRSWSILARALEAEGDWRRAEAVYWQGRRRFPENVQSHSQLAHALFVHGGTDLGESVYREAIALFPDNPVCRTDLGYILRSTGRYDEALVEFKSAQAIFHRSYIVAIGIADVLIEMGDIANARSALEWAEHVAPVDDHASSQSLMRARRKLESAALGTPLGSRKSFQLPPAIEGGLFSNFSNITGSDISNAPALGKASVLRRKGKKSIADAISLLSDLPESAERVAEQGLCIEAQQGWEAASAYFDSTLERYSGTGMLRVHRQRARVRSGQIVDWTLEMHQFPELVSVILTEDRGKAPHIYLPDIDDRSQEQLQDIWFAELIEKHDPELKDRAEEDYLLSRHVA